MRWARRVDNNQADIVAGLRADGARVKVIHQPFDIQVWATTDVTEYRSMYMEVKNAQTAYGRNGMNAKQAEEANGMPVAMVDSIESALRALNVLRSKK